MEKKNKKPYQKENTRERYSQSDPITQIANPKQSHGGRKKRGPQKGVPTGRQDLTEER